MTIENPTFAESVLLDTLDKIEKFIVYQGESEDVTAYQILIGEIQANIEKILGI